MSLVIEQPGKAIFNVAVSGDAHNGDMAGNVKSKPIYLGMLTASLDIVWTGSPDGTITVYASNSHDTTPAAEAADNWNGTWNSINDILSPAVTGATGAAAGSINISLAPLRYRHVYVNYARTGGSGTLTTTFAVVEL